MKVDDQSQFHQLAPYYDFLNDWKDYRREAQRLESIASRFGRPGRATWLDVACGTGRHLEFLRRRHSAMGVDASPEMLRIARRRLPGVRLIRGDMRTFRLNRRFDVVSCLFSAIGHLKTKADVLAAFTNFARHLNPGGVAIVEPWILTSSFRTGFVHLRTYQDPTMTIARVASSSRRGSRSRIHYHFLIGEVGREVRHFEETDVGLLLSRDELVHLMGRAGLRPRFLARGFLPGRGLLLGIKPRARQVLPLTRSRTHPRTPAVARDLS